MLWVLPTAVFTAANLWGYMGREIPYFNLRPENSIVDRAVASAKLASAVYGIEYIGVGVANITMSSYGQKTIDQPKQDDQFPTPFIEAASHPSGIMAPNSESDSSSPEESSWTSTLYDFFTLFARRPRLSWWTVYPQILIGFLIAYLALLSFRLISLREKVIDIQERTLVVHQILHTLGITIVQLDTILGAAKKTLSRLPEENTRIRRSVQTMTVKMDEVLGGMGGVQEWHDNKYKGICERLQSLESSAQTVTVKMNEMLGRIGRIREWQDKYKGICERLQSLESVTQPIGTRTQNPEIDLNKSLDETGHKDSLAEFHVAAEEGSKKLLEKDGTPVPVPSTKDNEFQNSTTESKLPLNPEQSKTPDSHGLSEDTVIFEIRFTFTLFDFNSRTLI